MSIKINKLKSSTKVNAGYCRRTTAGNVVEYTTMVKRPTAPPVLKLDKDHYVNTSTGELAEYQHTQNRSESSENLLKTFKKIRALVNANCTDTERLHWVTLTYAENMTDTERLYRDINTFWKRFKRYCSKHGYTAPEYIMVIEPQARGAWHAHALLIWDIKRPFIPNPDFADMWGNGFVNIKGVPDGCDNIGAYLSAYLGDCSVEEYQGDLRGKEIKEVNGKRYVKGGRLHMYPTGMNIVRASRGVKKPTVEEIDPQSAHTEKILSGHRVSRSVFAVQNESVDKGNLIAKEYYNTKRQLTQGEKLLSLAVHLGIEVSPV